MDVSSEAVAMPIRLRQLFGPLFGRGFPLALVFAAAQLPLIFVFGTGENAPPVFVTAFVIAHTVFIAAVTDFGMRFENSTKDDFYEISGPACMAGLILAVPIMLAIGGIYRLMLSGHYIPSELTYVVPVTWATLAATAAPARLLALLRGCRIRLTPLHHRLSLAVIFALPLLLPIAIPLPTGEGFGLMEGGLFILPFVGALSALYLFGACLMLALLSAAAVRK